MLAPSRIFVVASLVLLTPALARRYAGPVDMQAACQEQYANSQEQGIRGGNGASDWYCYNPNTAKPGGVNVDEYCQFTYGGTAYADSQGGGADDWACYYPWITLRLCLRRLSGIGCGDGLGVGDGVCSGRDFDSSNIIVLI
jgi:hypothetical protein